MPKGGSTKASKITFAEDNRGFIAKLHCAIIVANTNVLLSLCNASSSTAFTYECLVKLSNEPSKTNYTTQSAIPVDRDKNGLYSVFYVPIEKQLKARLVLFLKIKAFKSSTLLLTLSLFA